MPRNGFRHKGARAAGSLASTIFSRLNDKKKDFGISIIKRGRSSSSKGRTQVKVRRDGNGGLIITTNEPNANQILLVECYDPQASLDRIVRDFEKEGHDVALK